MMAPTPALPRKRGREKKEMALPHYMGEEKNKRKENLDSPFSPTPSFLEEGGGLWGLTLALPYYMGEGREGFYMLVGWVVCIFMHVHQYFGIGGQIGGQKNFWWTMVKMALSQGNQRFNNVRE